jgi:hypothetical protein
VIIPPFSYFLREGDWGRVNEIKKWAGKKDSEYQTTPFKDICQSFSIFAD